MKKAVLILLSLTAIYCGSEPSRSLEKADQVFNQIERSQFDSLYTYLTSEDQSAMSVNDFTAMMSGINLNSLNQEEMSGDTTYISSSNGDSVWIVRKYFMTDRAKVREMAGSKDKYSETMMRLQTENNVPMIIDSAMICLVKQKEDYRLFLNCKNYPKYSRLMEEWIGQIADAVSIQTENITVEKLDKFYLVRFQMKFTNGNKFPINGVHGDLMVNNTKAGIYGASFDNPLLPDSSISFKSTTDLKQFPALESLIEKKKTLNDLTREPIEIKLWSAAISNSDNLHISEKAMKDTQFYMPLIFPPLTPDLRNR